MHLVAKVLKTCWKLVFINFVDGFIYVNELLQLPIFRGYSETDIRRVDSLYEKKRFSLQTDAVTQKLKIKANDRRTYSASLAICQETMTVCKFWNGKISYMFGILLEF